MTKVHVTSRQAAEGCLGERPHSRRIAAPYGPFGCEALNSHVTQAINGMTGRRWAIEDDCISFTDGVIVWDDDRPVANGWPGVFRVIDWNGVPYRGATTPLVALAAFDRGMKR